MADRLLELVLIIFHALWVAFMLTGFFWTVLALFFHRRFFDFFWFRTLHMLGIMVVSLFPLLGRYCPLTIWENLLRQSAGAPYEGGFIHHYLEKFVYPDIDPAAIHIGTFVVAFVTIAFYFLRPPERTKRWFRKISSGGPL